MAELVRNLLVILFWLGVFMVVVYIGHGIFSAPESRKREALEREKDSLERKIIFLQQDIEFLKKVNQELQRKLQS